MNSTVCLLADISNRFGRSSGSFEVGVDNFIHQNWARGSPETAGRQLPVDLERSDSALPYGPAFVAVLQ